MGETRKKDESGNIRSIYCLVEIFEVNTSKSSKLPLICLNVISTNKANSERGTITSNVQILIIEKHQSSFCPYSCSTKIPLSNLLEKKVQVK